MGDPHMDSKTKKYINRKKNEFSSNSWVQFPQCPQLTLEPYGYNFKFSQERKINGCLDDLSLSNVNLATTIS